MSLTRRLIAPLLVGATTLLATVVPGALGAQTTASSGSATARAATAAVTSTGPTGAVEMLSATLTACHTDALAANRYAIFASQMTSVTGTVTMAVNFQLEERKGTGVAFVPVSAPGFGVWVSSAPGVGIYTYDHEVTALPAPAAFRVSVRARWFDRHHHVIRRDALVSPVCVQPLLAPDLAIGALTRSPGAQAGTMTYSVVVRNDGSAAAGPFQVSFSVAGVALPNAAVTALAAGAKQVVEFTGPRCVAGSTLTASADPAGAVIEPADPERTKTFPCIR
jgi:CARDB protein